MRIRQNAAHCLVYGELSAANKTLSFRIVVLLARAAVGAWVRRIIRQREFV